MTLAADGALTVAALSNELTHFLASVLCDILADLREAKVLLAELS